jgi:hypothetical protein
VTDPYGSFIGFLDQWVAVTTAVTTNIPKCVLKGILVQISGVEALKTCLLHCLPHMLDSNNVN